MTRALFFTLGVLGCACFIAACGDNGSPASTTKKGSQRGTTKAATPATPPVGSNECDRREEPGGVLTRKECGPARITIEREKSRAKIQGTCTTGPAWFELSGGTSVLSAQKTPKAKDLRGARISLTVGRRNDDIAGAALKPAPKDGTYAPIAMVGSINGHAFNAFRESSATLRGGRTEGVATGVEPDGTKVSVTFTCRKL